METRATPIRVGIAGLGRSGWAIHGRWISGLPERYKIVAAMDARAERRAEAEAAWHCRSYDTFDALLADEAVELLVVATPSQFHTEHTLRALAAGRHVVCEKPVALNVAEMDRMIQGASQAKRVLAPFQNMRYAPDFRQVRQVIDSGLLGRILLVRLAMHGFSRRWDWQTLVRFGGGLLSNNGSHILDQAVQFLGTGEPQIFADMQNGLSSGDAEDHAKVLLKTADGPTVDIEVTSCCATPQERWLVTGTSGGLTGSPSSLRWRWVDWSGMPPRPLDTEPTADRSYNREQIEWQEDSWTPTAGGPSPEERFYQDLYETLREDKPLVVTPENVRRYVHILDHRRQLYVQQLEAQAVTTER